MRGETREARLARGRCQTTPDRGARAQNPEYEACRDLPAGGGDGPVTVIVLDRQRFVAQPSSRVRKMEVQLSRRVPVAMIALMAVTACVAGAQTKVDPPRMSDGKPALGGVWDFRTLTPLERPGSQAGQAVLTAKEVAEIESRSAARAAAASAPTAGRTAGCRSGV